MFRIAFKHVKHCKYVDLPYSGYLTIGLQVIGNRKHQFLYLLLCLLAVYLLVAVQGNIELTIRVCSLESMDNSCGMFRYQNEYMQVSQALAGRHPNLKRPAYFMVRFKRAFCILASRIWLP